MAKALIFLLLFLYSCTYSIEEPKKEPIQSHAPFNQHRQKKSSSRLEIVINQFSDELLSGIRVAGIGSLYIGTIVFFAGSCISITQLIRRNATVNLTRKYQLQFFSQVGFNMVLCGTLMIAAGKYGKITI